MTSRPSDDEFIEAYNKGGAAYVARTYGGKPSDHRVRAYRLRAKGKDIQKHSPGRPKTNG